MESGLGGLSEFISRRGRMKILAILLEESESPAEVARKLGVTRTAVYGWRDEKKRHPSNKHTRDMIGILNEKSKSEVREILFEELNLFRKLIFSYFLS